MEEKGDALKQKIEQEKDGITTISLPLLKQMATTKKTNGHFTEDDKYTMKQFVEGWI
jgi:hypothetical protein